MDDNWVRQPDPDPVSLMADQLVDVVAINEELRKVLRAMVEYYVSLINSGDCGHWNPELEPVVMSARAAIARAEAR